MICQEFISGVSKSLHSLLCGDVCMFGSKWQVEEVIVVEILVVDDVVEEDVGRVRDVGMWPVVHGDTLFFACTLDGK